MKKAFHGFISKLNIADERNTELKNMSIETSKTEKQGEQKFKKRKETRTEYPRTMGKLQTV